MALFINGIGQDTFSMNGVDIDNLYVDDVLVWQRNVIGTESTILYTLEDALTGSVAQYYIPNLGVGQTTYDGKLEYVGDGTEAEGNPFDPGALYPLDGTIDLEAQADGKGSTQINTQYNGLFNTSALVQVVYDVVPGVSYKMYAIWYKLLGDVDIWMGDSVNGYPVDPTYVVTGHYPPNEPYKITSELPDVIPTPINTEIIYAMNSFIKPTPTDIEYAMDSFITL